MTEELQTNLSLEDMDRHSLFHGYTSIAQHDKDGPFILDRGSGINITGHDGKEYLDAVAGLWCVNLGWGRREIIDAISAQLEKLSYYHIFTSLSNEPAIRLAHRILQLAPPNMSKVFFGNSGSDANDTNVKLVWYYNNLRGKPEKRKIISRKRAYHGVTVATASLTGLSNVHTAFNLPLPMVLHTETPHYWRHAEPGMSERDFSQACARKLEEMILAEGPETVAAFIAEPVMGAGGVIIPPEGYFPEIQRVLRKYDVLMIADEVITGFGRTGNWFGSETYAIEPDMMTIAKGLTSGYVPMSGSIISEEIWEVIKEGPPGVAAFAHGYTYSAHPVAAAAAMANLDIMERLDLPQKCAEVGAYFQRRLREVAADHPLVGEVRGDALLAAVELVKDRETKEAFDPDLLVGPMLSKYSMEEGLITRSLPLCDAVSFSPPLVITTAEVDEALELFGRALNRVADELVRAGTWNP
jgi:L-2,4-diaminobutyrate transaminase